MISKIKCFLKKKNGAGWSNNKMYDKSLISPVYSKSRSRDRCTVRVVPEIDTVQTCEGKTVGRVATPVDEDKACEGEGDKPCLGGGGLRHVVKDAITIPRLQPSGYPWIPTTAHLSLRVR